MQLGQEVAEQLTSENMKVKFFQVDVSDKTACIEAMRTFTEENGSKCVHLLVNCAAYFGSKGLTAEKADWDRSFGVNVMGYANTVQAAFEYMKGTPGDKSVVNIASISGHRAQPNRWTYSATKGAILSLTKCMALDLSEHRIRVNSVSPAWVWGPEVEKAAVVGGREKWEPIWGRFHMPRRLSECAEIAAAVCFLLSDEASFVTGTDLPVDGGYLSMGPEGLGEHSSFAGTNY